MSFLAQLIQTAPAWMDWHGDGWTKVIHKVSAARAPRRAGQVAGPGVACRGLEGGTVGRVVSWDELDG